MMLELPLVSTLIFFHREHEKRNIYTVITLQPPVIQIRYSVFWKLNNQVLLCFSCLLYKFEPRSHKELKKHCVPPCHDCLRGSKLLCAVKNQSCFFFNEDR